MEKDVALQLGDPAPGLHQQILRRPQHGLRLRLLPWLRDSHEQVTFEQCEVLIWISDICRKGNMTDFTAGIFLTQTSLE